MQFFFFTFVLAGKLVLIIYFYSVIFNLFRFIITLISQKFSYCVTYYFYWKVIINQILLRFFYFNIKKLIIFLSIRPRSNLFFFSYSNVKFQIEFFLNISNIFFYLWYFLISSNVSSTYIQYNKVFFSLKVSFCFR